MKKRTIAVMVLIFVVALILLGGGLWVLCRHVPSKPEVGESFRHTYSGIQWVCRQKDAPTQKITIEFDGVRMTETPFQGDIIIKTGEKVLYEYRDCYVYENEDGPGWYVITPTEFSEEWRSRNLPRVLENYGLMYASEDWSKISFTHLTVEAEYPNGPIEKVFTAPADDLEDAIAVANEVAKASPFNDDFWVE